MRQHRNRIEFLGFWAPPRALALVRSAACCRICATLFMAVSSVSAETFTDANWTSLGGFCGANGPVNAAAVDSFGNLYIGGGFTIVENVFATSVAKWNGSNWTAL